MSQALKYLSKLQNQRILVLGGTSGIGFCVAEAAAEHGADVIVSGFSATKLTASLKRLRQVQSPLSPNGVRDDDRVSGTTCDLASAETLESSLTTVLDFATINGSRLLDHVVYTAGDPLKIIKFPEADIEAIHKVSMVRLTAPTILARLLPKYVKQTVSSSLTLTSGVTPQKPPPGWSLIVAAGAAVVGLTRGLAVDLSPMRVNAVAPGAVYTELFKNIPRDKLQSVLDQFSNDSITRTVGKPEELAEAYIACMKCTFMTGSIVVCDGGKLLV